ncbi:MAG: carboxypeptidase regulatory-like domain-containing protein [Planctomycetes bacterium]|nr:carboxypeptidase regulatory-like domain-containing protein [Planctomycetota bacterium]
MPVANVIVRLTPGYPRQGNLRYEAISDQDGKYQILNLPPGDYNLRVQSATHPPSPQRSAKFNFNTLLSGEYRERDLVLRAGSVISGTVTNAELKTPIAGAKVKLGITSDQPEVTTDADGYFELLSSPGYENQSLTVRAKDFGNFSVKVFQVPEDGVEVFVALLPARKASGRVVDQHGNPIGEVHICASAYDHSPQHGEQIENLRTMTQPDGTFEIRNLRQDLRHSLLLGHQDYATAIFDFPLEEWDGMQLELGDLPMEPPASIQGRVVDLEDMPLPHLWVLLSGEPAHRDDLGPSQDPGQGYLAREGMGFGRISARTNSDGRFVFSNLPSGQYWLSAGAKGYAKRGNLELSLKPGEEKDQVEIKFDRGLAIQGVVVNSKGDPLPEASVTIHQPNSFNQLSYTLCDSQGKFEIWGIPAGEYRLTASSGFRRRTELAGTPLFWEMIQEGVAAGTGGMRIELPDLGQLRGKVLGPNGVPVKGALVSVSFEREGFGPTAVTLPDGSFTILAPTNRSLFIQAYPPNQNDNGAFAPIIDDTGKVDMSYFSTEVRASGGSPELTLHLPKLILGSGE